MRVSRLILINIIFWSLLLFINPLHAQDGASLFLEPASGSFAVNSTFSVSIFLNTNGRSANTVEADLSFPADKLQVVSPTTNTSFFKIWLGVPSYSNTEGNINLKGGVPSPGINANKGLVTTVTFRVKSTGQAKITFTDQSKVLADDGQATDILANKGGSVLNLILPPPAGPLISSLTHPDQAQWYHDNSPIFIWNKDPQVSGFSYVLNKEAIDFPDDTIDSIESRVRYSNLEDGFWFFHLKGYSSGSGWGGMSHYQILVDKTPPAKFPIVIEPRNRTTLHRPLITFSTTDNASGIDHYEIKILRTDVPSTSGVIDKKAKTPFFIEATSPYQSSLLDLGKYDVLIRAYDKAGNFSESQSNLEIVSSAFEFFDSVGFGVQGVFFVPWWLFWIVMGILLIILAGFAYHFWSKHRMVRARLASGAINLPSGMVEDLKKLRELQERYQK